MDQAEFEARLLSISRRLTDAKDDYEFKTKKDTWSNIGTNRLDIAFTELSKLYLEADDVQRKNIFDLAGSA